MSFAIIENRELLLLESDRLAIIPYSEHTFLVMFLSGDIF
jgi:hypothetical protein